MLSEEEIILDDVFDLWPGLESNDLIPIDFLPRPRSHVAVRSHRGSGQRVITRRQLRLVSHLPQSLAAAQLGIGNTRFKSLLRELGLSGWPYRTVRSLRAMMFVLRQNHRFFLDLNSLETLVGKLERLESAIFSDPSKQARLSTSFKSLRSSLYKLKAKVSEVQTYGSVE